MAKYDKPTGEDALELALGEVSELKNRVQALEGRRLETWDRVLDHTRIPAPVEGQVVVEAETEAVWYFSNGEWRMLGGTHSGACVTLTADWTNPSNGNNAVAWDELVYDTGGFTDSGTGHFLIPVDGLYIVSFLAGLNSFGTSGSLNIYQGAGGGSPVWPCGGHAVGSTFFHNVTIMRHFTTEVSEGVPRAVFATGGKSGGSQVIDAGDAGFGSPYFTIELLAAFESDNVMDD